MSDLFRFTGESMYEIDRLLLYRMTVRIIFTLIQYFSEHKVVIVGLNNAGKTTILYQL